MSHELEIKADGTASMFSGENITPWHNLGTVIAGLATAKEALELASLDWTVEKQPLFFGEHKTGFPGQFATVRVSDQKPLGVVSDGYHVFQNVEAFDFLDAITDTGSQDAVYTSAGSLFGGKRVFITMKIGDGITVGDDDAHDMYLMATNSHDGTQAFTASVSLIRAVCNNTVTMALNSAKSKWALRHKSALSKSGRVQEARDALNMSFKYADAFEEEVAKLMAVEVSKDQFNTIAKSIVPESKFKHDKDVQALMDVFENEKTVNMGGGEGTGWGAFNAVTYFVDHVREYRTDESKFKSIVGTVGGQAGFGESMRSKAHNRILALA